MHFEARQILLLEQPGNAHAWAEELFRHVIDHLSAGDPRLQEVIRLVQDGMLQPVDQVAVDWPLQQDGISPRLLHRRHRHGDGGIFRCGASDDFDHREHVGRLKEMHREEPSGILQRSGQLVEGQSGCIGRQDRAPAVRRFNLSEHRLLHRPLLEHGLDDEIGRQWGHLARNRHAGVGEGDVAVVDHRHLDARAGEQPRDALAHDPPAHDEE